MTVDVYDRLHESVAPTHPLVIPVGAKNDYCDCHGQSRVHLTTSIHPSSPIARVTDDANDTMNANIDTSMPLSKCLIGESSHAG